ncbi:thioesterase family protein [Burkholderia sp. FERM BP-3421]|jgi:acyl-CoA thioester hydrolase|uniref:acyl-CoA thioesterase n=1 Tax=Burkholderia sp. FERM BP-3421 TaxID=1494466 RepID=UPI0023602C8F|nr:thioesterase family protein [Burkholderia sp. FERM BP-3421]WDD95774.1 thioesterase family protein [Burkholderia sp. FERM BP-3421]
MSNTPITHTIVPRWADIDATHHLRHSAYSDWATHMRTEWMNGNGFTLKRLMEFKIVPFLTEERTQYIWEIYLGESITVDLTLVGINHNASRFFLRQHFTRRNLVCARHEVKGAWMNITERRLSPPPPGLLELMQSLPRAEDYAELVD